MADYTLAIENLRIRYANANDFHTADAVKGVSLQVKPGEALGLVGESGSGKSSIGRAVVGLVPPYAGSITVCGDLLDFASAASLTNARRQAQMIFQDPQASLNPRMRIQAALAEPLAIHGSSGSKAEHNAMAIAALEEVGIDAAAAQRYPHEFSGGQRQRIAIARALMLRPSLVIADEPVSALDVSVQAHVLNLMRELQASRDLSYLFISHDLAVVGHMCPQIAVMYQGEIVETGPREKLLTQPEHEYTKLLLASATRM